MMVYERVCAPLYWRIEGFSHHLYFFFTFQSLDGFHMTSIILSQCSRKLVAQYVFCGLLMRDGD